MVERHARKARGGASPYNCEYWERLHRDGTVVWIDEIAYREGFFRAGRTIQVLTPSDLAKALTMIVEGREEAKTAADAASECPQPCLCKPWRQVFRIRK